ncbi:hypothetical protein H9Q72_003294 [Fusarium xylarioides]|uniref:Uncharacterized protein n=1 Tax=Fusarium xylarioides TaxID=221167 RepID=A0A9P7HYR0_9HYPO|nr:hypothetical protein H9Q70_005276 [Fusarium xylarioides]KAG5769490.1 hypothetical protein H9Q72_003294 [Fusarium xylarioides]KAG5780462.1 hypothetical protein H9Q73_005904 [Fusarium xylarioides]
MPSTSEAGVRITLYQAPSDPHDILRAKDEIIAKLTARITQLNADKEDLQARLTKRDNDTAILQNVIEEQAVEIRDLKSKIRLQGKQIKDLMSERHVSYSTIDGQAYEIGELKAQVSKQERELQDQGRENEDLETQLVIFRRVIDEDNISTSSGSFGTDYDLMDLSSDEEEEEQDIYPDNDISSITDNNILDNFSAVNIESDQDGTMGYN